MIDESREKRSFPQGKAYCLGFSPSISLVHTHLRSLCYLRSDR